MDRMYKKADKVNVYASAKAKADGAKPIKQVERVPYSYCGYDSYRIDAQVLPGYVDAANGADACVFLNKE